MGTITVLTNPHDSDEKEEFSFSGRLIDWLEEKYPHGFHGPHVTIIDGNKLDVENYDVEIVDHDIVIAIAPTGAPAAIFIGKLILGALISAAINYAINKFFGPKATKPRSVANVTGLPAASPTYTLNRPTNVVRLGQPIPVAYGRNLIVPDIASQPYTWYENNEQFVAMLLCLGQGDFYIHGYKIAGTDVSDLKPGVVYVWMIPKSNPGNIAPWLNHNETFGSIQGLLASYGIFENIYTSEEVSDQELVSASGYFSTLADLWNGPFGGALGNETEYGMFWLHNEAWELFAIMAGTTEENPTATPVYMIILDGPNVGVWRVTELLGSSDTYNYLDTPDWIRKRGHIESDKRWVSAETKQVYLSLSPDVSQIGAQVGPFAACPSGTTTDSLQYDIVFPNGLYKANDETGALEAFGVDITFTADLIDDSGNLLGPSYTYVWTEVAATNTAQRRTLHHGVPQGRYAVTARRTSAVSARAQDQSQVFWTGLKSRLGNTMGQPTYGDTTLLAVRVQATQGISSDAANRFSVDCTRVLNGAVTRNPMDACVDIVTNQIYGGKRPLAELDSSKVAELRTAWNDCAYFDAVFDSETNVWDAMSLALQGQRTAPTMFGSTITFVQDKAHAAPMAAFTEDNIKSFSMNYLFSDGQEADGVEVSYRDPSDNSEMFALYPPDSVDPEQMVLGGCRDYDAAYAYAVERWKMISLRRRIATMTVELDANIVSVGSPIHVTYPRFLGDEPVMFVVNSITPKDDILSDIQMHRYEPGVFA